jgi:glycosyltransferase involved in cell wall biosynthesis
MNLHKCCVVIATYNNHKTLQTVLDGILEYTSDIVVVNDGSTQETLEILENYPQIEKIHLPENKGKGNALKQGFKRAVQLGFNYAITLDSDGQHFPADIPVFVEELVRSGDKEILLIGDRNMNEANVLARSRRGNRVSTYWVKAVTGLDLKDSQSGFRLYPVKALDKIRFFNATKKFEFEVEVIVKAHWADIEVKNVPINILYDQKERVSHFRPFMDISRIVILIIWFLLVKFFYIIPRNFFRGLKKKGIKRFFLEDFLRSGDSPRKKALSIALGVFIGLSPLWGFHTIIVIFLAILLKLNKVIAFAFSNISLPPFIPFVLLMSLQTGNLVLGQDTYVSREELVANFDLLRHLEAYLIGSLTLSVTAAVVSGVLGYLILSLFQQKKIVANG